MLSFIGVAAPAADAVVAAVAAVSGVEVWFPWSYVWDYVVLWFRATAMKTNKNKNPRHSIIDVLYILADVLYVEWMFWI